MRNLSKLFLLSFGLIAIGLSTITTGLTSVPAFADKDKNQNSSPKINCEIHINAEDNLNNNDFGPNEQQCLNNSNNIKDSTVIQNPQSNGGTDSLKVVSTDPGDGDNNVPVDLSEIKVKFNKNIDKNSVDTESLALFANNCGTAICNEPDIQSVSVNGKSATFTIDSNDRFSPDTNYIASLLKSIKDEDGNFLDCFDSKAVDDNCEWNFSTSGSTLNPTISLNPTSGTVATLVTVTGNGFVPISTVAITFDGSTVAAVTPSTPAGFFTATFKVPPSSIGDHTVKATEGSNSASKTFTVTSSAVPTIVLNPTSGPVGTSINITGVNFDPNSEVRIFFFGTVTDTLLSTVTTNNIGEFSTNSTVPDELPGQYTVEANGGSSADQTIFTVTPQSTLSSSSLPPTSQSSPPNLSEKMILPDIFA